MKWIASLQAMRGAALAAFLLSSHAATAQELDLAKFDRNRNGVIDDGEEARVYLLHKRSALFRKYDRNFNGRLDPDEIAAIQADADSDLVLPRANFSRDVRAGKITLAPRAKPADAPKPVERGQDPDQLRIGFLLRRSFEDISILTDPFESKKAAGAQFGWERDNILRNRAWSAKGVIAAPVWWENRTLSEAERLAPHIVAYAFAPTLKFERVSNSRLAAKDVDLLVPGASGEIAFANLLGGTQYLRGSAALATSFAGRARSWNISAEWQPVFNKPEDFAIGSPNRLFDLPFTWTLSPRLRTQYIARLNEADDPIFASRNRLFRIGPALALNVAPIDMPSAPDWAKRLNFHLYYGWLQDLYSRKRYAFLDAGAGFNLDQAGNVAATLTYTRGKIEETGQNVSIVKLGLAVKLCQNLSAAPACNRGN